MQVKQIRNIRPHRLNHPPVLRITNPNPPPLQLEPRTRSVGHHVPDNRLHKVKHCRRQQRRATINKKSKTHRVRTQS